MQGWNWKIWLAIPAIGLLLVEWATGQHTDVAGSSSVAATSWVDPSARGAVKYASYYRQEELETDEDLEDWLSDDGIGSPRSEEGYRPNGGEGGHEGTHAHRHGDESCHSCGCSCDCHQEDHWRLLPHGLGCGVDVHGWIDSGGTEHDGTARSRFNGPVTFNDRDEIQFNQVYLVLEKSVNNGGCGTRIGGRFDLLFGTDHRFTMARGLEVRQDLSQKWNNRRFYGLALPQAYVEAACNNLSVKLGHFYTIVGYETVAAPENFFYSHAYTM